MVNDQDVLFLNDKSQWPCDAEGGKYCCLKRNKDHGFIWEGSWTVHLGYIFDGGSGEEVNYESSEAILKDGWIVD